MENRRYRLKSNNGNYYKLQGKARIRLNIPVTEEGMDYEESVNISSKDLNAILVRIEGSGNETKEEPVVGFVSEVIEFNEVDLKESDFDDNPFLVVAIHNDNKKLKEDKIEIFKAIIENSFDCIEAVNQLRNLKKNKFDDAAPSENGGDVIGGNG